MTFVLFWKTLNLMQWMVTCPGCTSLLPHDSSAPALHDPECWPRVGDSKWMDGQKDGWMDVLTCFVLFFNNQITSKINVFNSASESDDAVPAGGVVTEGEERGCQIRGEQGRDGDGEKKNARHHLELHTPRTVWLLETVWSSECNFHLRHGASVCTRFTASPVGCGEFIPLSLKKKVKNKCNFIFIGLFLAFYTSIYLSIN